MRADGQGGGATCTLPAILAVLACDPPAPHPPQPPYAKISNTQQTWYWCNCEIHCRCSLHYLPANHSVAQSSFDDPCQPLSGAAQPGFFSGFQPTAEGQAPNVFQIVVQDKKPIWYYCAQTKGSHCQKGMAGVINQNFDSPNTLAAYKANAVNSGVSGIPPYIGGGWVIPNPNPNGGF